ncbi:hypothetical protein ACCO45_010907 [Purpureocillium lilacinum]|uniref:Uncharacterized protein n=1 Tax=Purpureocillium lilacinum TaxID=33203 RepID=A0ACC4DHK6_PURLI
MEAALVRWPSRLQRRAAGGSGPPEVVSRVESCSLLPSAGQHKCGYEQPTWRRQVGSLQWKPQWRPADLASARSLGSMPIEFHPVGNAGARTRWLYHAPRNTPVLWWVLALVLRGRRRTEAVLPSAQRPSWAQLARPGSPALNSRPQESPRPASERPRVSGAGGKGDTRRSFMIRRGPWAAPTRDPWGGGKLPSAWMLGELTMACSVGEAVWEMKAQGGFGQASCSHRARRLARLLACIHWDPASPQNVTRRSFASSWAHELSAQLYTAAASIVFPRARRETPQMNQSRVVARWNAA